MNPYFKVLSSRYPNLSGLESTVQSCFEVLCNCFNQGGKLLLAGNGGSGADAEHISGELLKSFEIPRPLKSDLADKLPDYLKNHLQGALPAIPLTNFMSLSTAFANDVDPELIFAQLVLALGQSKDVLLGISTSGNAQNIIYAFEVAKAKGMATILLTGQDGGKLSKIADITLKVPASRTLEVQELHLPIYHTICLMLEDFFFGNNHN